jgi:hypothetical protein
VGPGVSQRVTGVNYLFRRLPAGFGDSRERQGCFPCSLEQVLDHPGMDGQMGEPLYCNQGPTRSGPTAYLPASTNLLIKNPKLIADPVAIGSQAQCCHGVQKASWGMQGGGCQAPNMKEPSATPPPQAAYLPASRPRPPLPSPASSSISSSSSMSRPSWGEECQWSGPSANRETPPSPYCSPTPGKWPRHRHSPGPGSPWCSVVSVPCRTPKTGSRSSAQRHADKEEGSGPPLKFSQAQWGLDFSPSCPVPRSHHVLSLSPSFFSPLKGTIRLWGPIGKVLAPPFLQLWTNLWLQFAHLESGAGQTYLRD